MNTETRGGMKLRALRAGGRTATRDAIAAAAKLLRAGAEPWRDLTSEFLACAESAAAIAIEEAAMDGKVILLVAAEEAVIILSGARHDLRRIDLIFHAMSAERPGETRCGSSFAMKADGGVRKVPLLEWDAAILPIDLAMRLAEPCGICFKEDT